MNVNLIAKAFLALIVASAIAACSDDVAAPEKSRIEALADEVLEATLERYPAMGTYFSIEGARHDRL